MIEVIFWNIQTCSRKKVDELVQWTDPSRAIGVCEYRAEWTNTRRLSAVYQVVTSQNNEFAWLLPQTWRVQAIEIEETFIFGVSVEVSAGRVVTLAIVHLSCDTSTQREQLTSVASMEWRGQWIIGGDYNCEHETSDYMAAMDQLGASCYCSEQPTHYRDQRQQDVVGYRSRNLDRIWTMLKVGDSFLVRTPGMSDHKMVVISSVEVSAVDTWHRVSYKRKTIYADSIARAEPQSDLEMWVRSSQDLPTSREVGWDAFVGRLEHEFKAGVDVSAHVHRAAAHHNEHVQSVTATVKKWIAEMRTERLAALSQGKASRLKTNTIGKSIFAFRSVSWIIDDGSRIDDMGVISDKALRWATLKFAATEDRLANTVAHAWARDLWTDRIDGKFNMRLTEMSQLSIYEVEIAINQIGHKHNAGADGWEALSIAKLKGSVKRKIIMSCAQWIDDVTSTGTISDMFSTTLMTIIPKAKKAHRWEDLRPIECDTWPVRVLSKILAGKLNSLLPVISKEQFGFVSGRSTMAPIHIVNDLVKRGECVLFLDISSAYTSIDSQRLQAICSAIGMPQCTQNCIAALTNPRKVHMVHNGRVSKRHARAQRGLRQGNAASPAIFNMYMAVALHRISKVLGDTAACWAFADDIAVWVKDVRDLKCVIDTIKSTLAMLDLHLNMSKCKLICTGYEVPAEYTSWCVDSYKYLGVEVPIVEAKAIKRTLEAVQKTALVVKSRRIPVHIAAQVFNTYLWSKVVYQGSVYALSSVTLDKVDDIVRSLCGVRSVSSHAYLGREIPALCEDTDRGGLGLIDYRAHADCMIGSLVQHFTGTKYWPEEHIDVLHKVYEARLSKVNPVIQQYLRDGIDDSVSVKNLRKVYPTLRVQRDAEPSWCVAWPQIVQLDPWRLQSVWRLAFDVAPCHEHWLRHSDVIEMQPCRWCGAPAVTGPSHMRRCVVFWSNVQWDGRTQFMAGQFHVFLRSASKDMIRAAVDLFDKYMHTPVSEWDEYVYTGHARKKRQRREQHTEISGYSVIENGMQTISVALAGGRLSIVEDINPTPQWRGEHVKLFTDGSYFPVWNVAAWAVVDVENNEKMTGGVLGAQTNNRAELTALIAAVTLVKKRGIGRVTIYSDSSYVVSGARGETRRLTNLDLWHVLDQHMHEAHVQNSDIEWVRAHAQNVGNGIADIAAKNEATRIAQNRVAYDPALDGWESDSAERDDQPQRQHWLIVQSM